MKPVKFNWVKTSDNYLARLVNTDTEFKSRVEKSITDIEDYLEELANKGDWDMVSRIIPYDQFVRNGILINDAGNENRMFLFVTLNKRTAEDIIDSLLIEHYTHIVYLDLIDSIKG